MNKVYELPSDNSGLIVLTKVQQDKAKPEDIPVRAYKFYHVGDEAVALSVTDGYTLASCCGVVDAQQRGHTVTVCTAIYYKEES